MEEASQQKLPRMVYIMIPLLIMALALGGWVWVRSKTQGTPQPQTTAVISTLQPRVVEATDIPGDGFGLIAGRATPWAVAGGPGEVATQGVDTQSADIEPAITPTITQETIALQGPPAGSSFRPDDVVSFYWSRVGESSGDQQFTIYLVSGDERLVLGTVNEANLGQGYRFQSPVGRVVGEAGSYSWLVVLVDENTGAIIGQSETRPISIVGDN